MTETGSNNEKSNWYVLRCAHGRERRYQGVIADAYGVETFVPMKKERQRDKQGRFVWVSSCALSSYIFVFTTKTTFMEMTNGERRFRAMSRKVENLWEPVVVPEYQMTNFMKVAGCEEEKVAYLDPARLRFRKGDRVRVIGGPFEGVEGEFLQIGGKHEKRVVIRLEGIVALATCAILASMVEKIV